MSLPLSTVIHHKSCPNTVFILRTVTVQHAQVETVPTVYFGEQFINTGSSIRHLYC